jgi:hypothetical protein
MPTTKEQKPVSSLVKSIEHPTVKLVMDYLKLEDYDCFVSFAKRTNNKAVDERR